MMTAIAIPLYIPIISRNNIPGIKLFALDKLEYKLDDIELTITNRTNKKEFDFILSKNKKM